MPAPQGTIQGLPVVITRRNAAGKKTITDYDAPFRLQQDSADTGPGATKVGLEFWVAPPDMDTQARNLKDLTDEVGFLLVTDPENIYFDDGHAFMRGAGIGWDRVPRLTRGKVTASYVGNKETHRLSLVATSRHLPNVWGIAARTSIHVPLGATLESLALSDPARRVVTDPAPFLSANLQYVTGQATRSGGQGILAHVELPNLFLSDAIRAIIQAKNHYGPGRALAFSTIRAPSQDVILNEIPNTVTVRDRIAIAGSADKAIEFPNGYTRASHGGSEFPAHPERHVVLLDNGAVLLVHANGNFQFMPAGAAFKAPGGATRALGSGVFYHSLGGAAYLVGTVDFTVAADGTVGYGVITYGAETILNPGFETWTVTPGVPPSWTTGGGAGVVFTKEQSIIRSGASSAKITAGGAGASQGLYQAPTLTAGVLTFVEAYARTAGGASEQPRLRIRNETDAVDVVTVDGTVAGTVWQRLFASFTPVAAKTYRIYLEHATPAAARVVYFDDASVKQYVSQAGTGDVDATFGVVHTAAVGAALTDRLRELLGDHLADYFLEAR